MNKKKHVKHNRFFVINDKTSFHTLESYKVIRTNLQFKLMNDNEGKCIVFTSANVSEGKSTTCINVAITFAQAGSRVLIIDADMRKPTVHRYLNVKSTPGLSDKICGFSDDDACIYRTDYENLFVMPAGSIPPNPAELLMSSRMDAFLDIFKKNFDYIFIDSPPVGVVTDAAVIGAKCNGVVFICREIVSYTDTIADSLESLKKAGVNILGFIMNDVNSGGKQKYYRKKYRKGYYYSYNSGYGYGSNSYGRYGVDNKEE